MFPGTIVTVDLLLCGLALALFLRGYETMRLHETTVQLKQNSTKLRVA